MTKPDVTAPLVAFLFVALFGCAKEALPPPREVAAASDADDARAALFLYAYKEGLRDAPSRRQMTCIAVEGGADPAPRLLQRLSGYGLNLRRASACRLETNLVVEPVSGLHGALLSIESFRMPEPGRAVGVAYCLWGLKAGIRVECILEFQLGRWHVVQETGRAPI